MLNYSEYREQWELQHPASVPQKPRVISEYPGWVKALVGASAIASAAISGVHTAPTIRRAIEASVAPLVGDFAAALSFVAIETSIFVAAYLRRKNLVLAMVILVIAMAVAVLANIVSVDKALGNSGDDGARISAIILGLAIPLMTYAAGEMFVHITSAGRAEALAAEQQYREALKAHDATINSAYTKYLKDAQARIPAPSNGISNGIPLESGRGNTSNMLPSESTLGHRKAPNATAVVTEYFQNNPSALDGNAIEIAALLGVGKSTVYTVMGKLKSGIGE